jgi:hypothetical protein
VTAVPGDTPPKKRLSLTAQVAGHNIKPAYLACPETARTGVRGLFVVPGQVSVRACRGDDYLTTERAAALVGVQPVTIRRWRARGYLATQALDERGYPLHSKQAVRNAEREVRKRGLEASGVDPRRVRKAA